jgi:hypothetical protein
MIKVIKRLLHYFYYTISADLSPFLIGQDLESVHSKIIFFNLFYFNFKPD